MRKLLALLLLLALFIVAPVSAAFAHTSEIDNTFQENGQVVDGQQGEIILLADSSGDSEEASSHDSHGTDEYSGHGGESKSGIYVSALSVIMIFVFIAIAYIFLRKHMKKS